MTPEDQSVDGQPVDDERLIADLFANTPPDDLEGEAGVGGDIELDPNVLAGFLEGRLTDDERAEVIAVLADSETARAQVADAAMYVSFDGQPPARVPSPQLRSRRYALMAVAAAALLAISVGLFVWVQDNVPARTLVATGEVLLDRNGDLFEGFEPAAPLPPIRDVERGGPTIKRPAGALLEGRPQITWARVSGVRVFRVLIRDDEGTVRYEQTAMEPELAYPKSSPALTPGAYVVVVSANTPSGQLRSSRAFTVLDEETIQRYRRGLIAIENDVDPFLREEVEARWALHFDLVKEAHDMLGDFVIGGGGGRADSTQRVRDYVHARRGMGR